jgi:hypothetical protein
MRNWKIVGVVSVAILAATVMASTYAPTSTYAPSIAALPLAPRISYMSTHKDTLHMRVAQSCIAHNQTCTLNGTPCCNSSDTCKGSFPNTTCQ